MAQPLRPLTVSELLDRTFWIYRKNFLAFVGIAALPNAIMLLIQLLSMVVQRTTASVTLGVITTLVMLVVYMVTSMLSYGATMVAVSQVQLGVEASVSEAFDRIRGRVGELLILSLSVSLRVMLGLLLLIIPGVIMALRYALAMPAAVLEDTGISASIERSRELTRGHLGRILLIYVLLFLLLIAGTAVWQLPVTLLVQYVYGETPNPMPVWLQTVNLVGSFLVNVTMGPLMTIGLSLVYYDERVRKEGFDLEHMLEQLEASRLNPSGVA